MNVALMTIGDELLIGQVVDTNSAWMAKRLNEQGFSVSEICTVGDREGQILENLARLTAENEVVLITGGLGPTKDDITKKTLAKFYDCGMVENADIKEHLLAYFKTRNRPVNSSLGVISMVPEACEVFINKKGTAASMWFEKNNRVVVSMPGVPYEMKDMMTRMVLPRLKEGFETDYVYHRTILTAGAAETYLAERVEQIESELPQNISLAFLPNLGKVRLRLTGKGNQVVKDKVDEFALRLKEELKELVYGEGELKLEEAIGNMLMERKATLALAESCTGGFVSQLVVAVPGSSRYYKGGVVAYAYSVKEDLLSVDKAMLDRLGAVSEETVLQMAEQVRKELKADYGVSISGIAGPGGGTPDKPVGTVWMAVSSEKETIAKKVNLTSNRDINIPLASNLALNMLRKFMMS